MSSRAIVAASALFLLGGCATQATFVGGTGEVRTGACERRSAEVLAIRGEIDAELADCVRDALTPSIRILALDTMGGSVEHALDMVEMLDGRDLTMRIEGECNSSCANYLLPLARKIELGPEAIVLLHGSIDPWTVERFRTRRSEFMALESTAGRDEAAAAANFETFLAKSQAMVERQSDFARRHDVRPGWLMYRLPGSGEIAGLTPQPGRGRALLVEEAMMRSCLPGIEIQPYQAQVERRWTRSYRRIGLLWARVAPSGETRCVDPVATS